jgi:hypothetical protein
MSPYAAIAIALAAAAAPALKPPPPPALETVLDRAGEYVVEFHHKLAGIVAEEHYVQNARMPPAKPLLGRVEHRELKSDLLLVNVSGTTTWLEFRDVFEVDGSAVRDRSDRLTQLFLTPSASSNDRIQAILNENARYNVGAIQRTVNTPVLPLAFLEVHNRTHFRFFRTNDRLPALAKVEVPAGSAIAAPFRAPQDAWVIRFEEVVRPTFIHTDRNRDLPSHGRFWVEPDTGRVLMSEVIAEDRVVRGTLTVSYQSEPLVGMLMPVAMQERYEGRRSKVVVDATATYGRFRQFQVSVDEKFLLKKEK